MKKILFLFIFLCSLSGFSYVQKIIDSGRSPDHIYPFNKPCPTSPAHASIDLSFTTYFKSVVYFEFTESYWYHESAGQQNGIYLHGYIGNNYYIFNAGVHTIVAIHAFPYLTDPVVGSFKVYELKPPKKIKSSILDFRGQSDWSGVLDLTSLFDYGDSKTQSITVGNVAPFSMSGNGLIYNNTMVTVGSSGTHYIDVTLTTELGPVLTNVKILWSPGKPCPDSSTCSKMKCPDCGVIFCAAHYNHGTVRVTCVNGKEHVFCRTWKQGEPSPPQPNNPAYTCPSCNKQACQLCGHICPNKCSSECTKAKCAKCGAEYCPTHDIHSCPNVNDQPNVPGTTHPDNDPPQSPPNAPPVDPETTPPLTDPDKCTSDCPFKTCSVCNHRYCPVHTKHTCAGATVTDPETGKSTTNPPASGGDVPTLDHGNPSGGDSGTGEGDEGEEDKKDICGICGSDPCVCADAPEAPVFDGGTGSAVDGVLSKLQPSIDSGGLTKGEIDVSYYFQIPWTGFVFDVHITTLGDSLMAVSLRTLRSIIRGLSVLVFSFAFLFRLLKYINP